MSCHVMQREGAGPNLNRELLLRLRRAAPKQHSPAHRVSLLYWPPPRLPRRPPETETWLATGNSRCRWPPPLSTPNASTAEMRQRTLVIVRTHETFVPSVFTANLRGGMVHKMDELEATLCECDVDIGCITETWLNKTVPSDTKCLLWKCRLPCNRVTAS